MVFAKLRALRKTLAEQEGVPAYAVFTNEQLAEMVQRRVVTATGLRDIPGIGEARADKHGAAFLAVLRAEIPLLAPPMTGDGDEA